ncbi:hypothetical protein ARSEF4850_002546 [Beauveria asiatica]
MRLGKNTLSLPAAQACLVPITDHIRNQVLILDWSQKPYYFLASHPFLSLTLDLVVALMALTLSILALYVKGSTSQNAAGLAFLNLITLGTGFNMVVNAWTAMEISEPAVLTKINLSIESGKKIGVKKIGVMGRTGSGKSSLLYSVLEFLEYEGAISIDRVDVKTADADELRSRIITITPELVEVDGIVHDNLLLYDKTWGDTKPGKPDAEQHREAERRDQIIRETLVRLRIWDRLSRKADLDAMLQEVGYSSGEKQLLCITRAVVRRRLTGSRLVLVDEATANVDT